MYRPLLVVAAIAVAALAAAYGLAKSFDFSSIGRMFEEDHGGNLPDAPFAWPPVLDEEYPDVALVDQTGNVTKLSDYRGKVILVELVGMPCAACQAFSGARKAGAFRIGRYQADLESIETYAAQYGKFDFNDEDVVFVQILLFDEKMSAPKIGDAALWAKHFGMDRAKNRIVLVGTKAMASQQSFELIPGFHLVDRDFAFVRDSSGDKPRHNLYEDLLPTMGKLVEERR